MQDIHTGTVFACPVRSLMERMGKTLFFRSGGEPLILSEEQREFRKNGMSKLHIITALETAFS